MLQGGFGAALFLWKGEFMMENVQQILAERERLQKKYDSARSNLLLAIVLTVVNIVLFFTGSGTMLLFSVSVPYYAVIFGDVFGIAPVGVCFAVVVLVAYFLCWLLSKKRVGWLIAALVLFLIDTLAMAGMYMLIEDTSGIMDGLIHIWVLYYLFAGVSAHGKQKKLPSVSKMPAEEEALPDYSTPLRRAEEDVKCRVLLESEYDGHRVCYRRVKRVNELVIDGQVYDEYEALVELPHTLTARLAGHTYEVGCSENSRTFFNVDGEQIESKIRLI